MKTALIYKGFDIKRGFAFFGLFRHRNFALTHKVINRGLRQKGWLVLFAEGNSVTCSRDACHCISGIVREEARFENFDAVNHLRIECIHKLLCACQGMHLDIHIFAIALKPYAKLRGAWRTVYVALLVICAIITPDASPVTMFLMFAAMIVLYELSLLLARVVLSRRIKRQNEELAKAEADE